MPRPSATQWLAQAQSDLLCAERCLIPGDIATFCHAIAKYQQAVEKAIKGLVVALKLIEPTRNHEAIEEIKCLTAFTFNTRSKANRRFAGEVSQLMSSQNRNLIGSLVQLAPKYPEAGEAARRNTEYPFQDARGGWKIPADNDAFSQNEVDQFRQVANSVVNRSGRVIVARQFTSS